MTAAPDPRTPDAGLVKAVTFLRDNGTREQMQEVIDMLLARTDHQSDAPTREGVLAEDVSHYRDKMEQAETRLAEVEGEVERLELRVDDLNHEIAECDVLDLQAAVARVEALADDLAAHGLRFDLNPTMPGSTNPGQAVSAWLNYIARMDNEARRIGDRLRAALRGEAGEGRA